MLEKLVEHQLQVLVVLVDIFKILLNFVKTSYGVLRPQLTVPELPLQVIVLLVELHPALVVRLLALAKDLAVRLLASQMGGLGLRTKLVYKSAVESSRF